MRVVNRKTVQKAPLAAYQRHLLVLVAALFAGCGGRGLHGTDGAVAAGASSDGNSSVGGAMAGGGNAQGGGGVASGGQTGEGGNTDLGGAMTSGSNAQGGGGVASGGRTAEGGAMTGGGGAVFLTVSTGGVRSLGGSASSGQDGGDSPDGLCESTNALIFEAINIYLVGDGSCMPTPDGKTSWGNIVIDSEGRVIDITRSGVSQTQPVEALAGLSWPCLAGQTIPYFCQIGG
jgi:hypothetical protein